MVCPDGFVSERDEKKICMVRNDGLICVLRRGHRGPHHAHGGYSSPHQRWFEREGW